MLVCIQASFSLSHYRWTTFPKLISLSHTLSYSFISVNFHRMCFSFLFSHIDSFFSQNSTEILFLPISGHQTTMMTHCFHFSVAMYVKSLKGAYIFTLKSSEMHGTLIPEWNLKIFLYLIISMMLLTIYYSE